MQKRLDIPANFVLIVLPIILITLTVIYILNYSLGWFEVISFLSGYYISNITVGIGLHRLWSHNTYKTNKYVEFILAMLAAGTLQGPILSWASNHFKHHTYTDTEKDPHTPLKYKNPVLGFFWAHMGWMLFGSGSYKLVDRITFTKMGKNKILRWQLKYYWQLAILMNTVLPLIVGYIVGGTLVAAYASFLFIGIGRALQQQVTFFVNSLCHFIGKKPYTQGSAGDVWWLSIFLLGENWHNFHHAFPMDYRNGVKWYQADVHKWIIFLMSKLGLAWDLKRTEKVRIKARASQQLTQFMTDRKELLQQMLEKVNNLSDMYYAKRKFFENSSFHIKKKLQSSLMKIQDNLNLLKTRLHLQLEEFSNPSDKIVKIIAKELKQTEIAIHKIYQQIENKTSIKI